MLKGTRLIIPQSLQRDMLQRLHESHQGIVKSKQLARDQIFWPGMNSQIEDVIGKCAACQSRRKAEPKEPMISHEIPETPWTKVGIDLFHFRGREYVLCVDYFSKYPDMCLLPDTSSSTTINAIKSIFGRFGIPTEVVTDSGPQFSSGVFKEFATRYEFKHTTISPTYSQSNGQIERTVQTVKNIMRKCDDITIGLLDYRNTPINELGSSPAQLLMSRRLRNRIPAKTDLLKPKAAKAVNHKLNQRQQLQKKYYDKRASLRPKHKLSPGDTVRFRSKEKGEWKQGIVQNQSDMSPRSFHLQSTEGRMFRRNRRHIFPTREKVVIRPNKAAVTTNDNTVPDNTTGNRPPEPPLEEPPLREPPPPRRDLNRPPPPPQQQQAPVTTRSGRVVNLPRRYQD